MDPNIQFSGPIQITKGGKYTGNFKSDDSNVPAILVSTYDPVEITGCNILHSGIGIKAYGGTKMHIHHNTFEGNKPSGNDQWGRALDDYHPQYLIFESNTVNHTGGLLIDHSDENTKSVVIRFNEIINVDKRRNDGSAGDHRAGILFNTVLPVTGEIAWNKFYNEPGKSYVEDNINLGNTGGLKDSPFLVHDNYIKGAYPAPTTIQHFTGSGITVEGHPSMNQYNNCSQFINIYNNQVVGTGNACINVNAGHDIHVYDNTMISAGMYPDGTKSNIFWGGGCIWNGSNLGPDVFKNIDYKNNKMGYVREDQSTPFPGRQDYVVVNESPISIKPGDNIHLPNPITLATEEAELVKWNQKLKDNKIVVGNSTEVVIPPVEGKELKVGATLSGKITPLNKLGTAAPLTSKSVTVTSSSASAKVEKNATDETVFKVTGVSAGKSTITVSLKSKGGKTLTKDVVVTVTDDTEEAVDIKVELK